MHPIPDEEGGNTYLCNGNLIPVGLAGISMVASAVSTLEEEPAADDTVQEQPPPEEPKPNSNKRNRGRSETLTKPEDTPKESRRAVPSAAKR